MSSRGRRAVSPRGRFTAVVAMMALAVCGCAPAQQAPSSTHATETASGDRPAVGDSSGLVWAEEFDHGLGDWRHSTGAGGWGVGSLVNYTDRPENAAVSDGILAIVAREEASTDDAGRTAAYTSARIVSLDSFLHGRFEARIKAPSGAGLWTAFWLLGIYDDATTWPNVGEIDVVELVREGDTLHSTVWGNWVDSDQDWNIKIETPAEGSWADEWHVYAADWSEDEVVFLVDGEETGRISRGDLEDGWEWALSRPVNIVLNLAVGGDWPGPPHEDTPFPVALEVDWVRVYDSAVTPRA